MKLPRLDHGRASLGGEIPPVGWLALKDCPATYQAPQPPVRDGPVWPADLFPLLSISQLAQVRGDLAEDAADSAGQDGNARAHSHHRRAGVAKQHRQRDGRHDA